MTLSLKEMQDIKDHQLKILEDYFHRMAILFEKYDNPFNLSEEYQRLRGGFILIHDITGIKLAKCNSNQEKTHD